MAHPVAHPTCGFPGIPGPAGRITGPGSSTGGCSGAGVRPVGNGKPCTLVPQPGDARPGSWVEPSHLEDVAVRRGFGSNMVDFQWEKTQGIRIGKEDRSRFKQEFLLAFTKDMADLPAKNGRFRNSTSINMKELIQREWVYACTCCVCDQEVGLKQQRRGWFGQ